MENKNKIDTYFEKMKDGKTTLVANKESIWDSIEKGLDEEKGSKKVFMWRPYAMVASVVLLAVIGIIYLNNFNQKEHLNSQGEAEYSHSPSIEVKSEDKEAYDEMLEFQESQEEQEVYAVESSVFRNKNAMMDSVGSTTIYRNNLPRISSPDINGYKSSTQSNQGFKLEDKPNSAWNNDGFSDKNIGRRQELNKGVELDEAMVMEVPLEDYTKEKAEFGYEELEASPIQSNTNRFKAQSKNGYLQIRYKQSELKVLAESDRLEDDSQFAREIYWKDLDYKKVPSEYRSDVLKQLRAIDRSTFSKSEKRKLDEMINELK